MELIGLRNLGFQPAPCPDLLVGLDQHLLGLRSAVANGLASVWEIFFPSVPFLSPGPALGCYVRTLSVTA